MTFARWHMLFLVWAAPLLLLVYAYGAQRRRTVLGRFATPRSLHRIAPEADPQRRWLRALLTLTAVGLSAVALAGPQYGYRWETVDRRGIDLVVAIDCSRSMLAEDIQPNRLQRAKREVLDLLDLLQGDRIALVAFAGTAFLQCPLTLDYQAVPIFLEALDPDYLPVGGSDIGAAIDTAGAAFDPESPAEKAMVLITDGEPTGIDPVAAAERIRDQGVKLFAIAVGSETGGPIPGRDGAFVKDAAGNLVLARVDLAMLEKIAHLTGGVALRSVAGNADLKRIYQDQIRGRMNPVELTGGRRKVQQDRYQWFLGAAVVLLLLEGLIPAGPRRRSDPALAAVLLLPALLLPAGNAWAGTLDRALAQGTEAYQQGDYETAVKHFTEAQLEAPERPEILYNLGNSAYRAGDYESAGRHYQQALTRAPNALRQKTQYNLGNTRFRQDRLEDALRHYNAALQLDPNDADARANSDLVKRLLEQQQAERKTAQPTPGEGEPPTSETSANSTDRSPEPRQESADSAAADDPAHRDQAANSRDHSEQRANDSATQYAKELAQPGAAGSEPGGDNAAQAPGEPAQPGPVQSGPAAPAASPAGDRGPLSALLNRLQDKPGAAARPHYQQRRVEKDW